MAEFAEQRLRVAHRVPDRLFADRLPRADRVRAPIVRTATGKHEVCGPSSTIGASACHLISARLSHSLCSKLLLRIAAAAWLRMVDRSVLPRLPGAETAY